MDSFEIFKTLWELDLPIQLNGEFWWPNYGTFEVVIGAVLTQQTKWENVEKSLQNLRRLGLLELESLALSNILTISNAIRPSGFYNKKSERLLSLAQNIYNEFGDFALFKESVTREWLLSIKGIGQETADSILCYACGRDVMVVDSYTARLCAKRYNLELQDYNELQEFLTDGIMANFDKACKLINQDADANKIFALFHGLIVEYSKRNTSKSILFWL